MADRKAELAAKKKQLEDLKRQRAERQQRSGRNIIAAPRSDVGKIIQGLDLPEKAAGTTSRRTLGTMSVVHHFGASIAPVENICYAKGVQTDVLVKDEDDEDDKIEATVTISDDVSVANTSDGPDGVESSGTDPVGHASVSTPAAIVEDVAEPPSPVELTSEQVAEILENAAFQSFFTKTSRVMERVLSVKYDPTRDYEHNEADAEAEDAKGEVVQLSCEFFSERYSTNRAVTALDWSTHFPELLVSAYNANPDAPSDPDGAVLVWNTMAPARPEYQFECQSAVLSVRFTPYSPNVCVGGTYSGQVVLWDNRAKKTPVQRSAINQKSHTHPVFCLDVVGSQNAHSLVTTSTDGKMCSWDMDTLNAPQETLDLQTGSTKAVAGTCFSFPNGDSNNFILGSEEGLVFQGSRHGAKAGVGSQFDEVGAEGQAESSHHGPVTAVDFFKVQSGGDFSHLFLSASTDWTVKLWSYRNPSRPLHTFENASDYVFDVKWSPTNPGVFASADGMGYLDIWNINNDIEQPTCHVLVGEGKQAINRVKWSGDGKRIAVGDAAGKVYVYDVADRVAVPRLDEASRLKETIKEIEVGLDDKISSESADGGMHLDAPSV